MVFRARTFEFIFPRPALVMGILNVTPDSFSDGGNYLDPAAAVGRAEAMVREGADIIDVGGESTRPGATPVSEAEELRRVLPIIEKISGRVKIPVSIDTMKPAVARAAIAAGASIINNVAAATADESMWDIAAESGAGYVAMHMQGDPQTMQANPVYGEVVREVKEFFSAQLGRLREHGLALEQVVLDVGIGFGKTREHNLQLLVGMGRFKELQRPLLLGVSRKSFLGKSVENAEDRLAASLACTALAAEAGVQMFRAHDVAATVQALRVVESILLAGGKK